MRRWWAPLSWWQRAPDSVATDIFPEVNIPVVTVIWSLTGISVDDMERRVLTTVERAFTTTVNDIEHIESQSMPRVGLIKVFFHPKAKIEAAIAQITGVDAAQANVTANEANVRRLLDLQSFQTLRAPFAGIVTVRNVDQGTLISAGNTTATTPAFRLAQIDSLRIFVNVPQTFVPSIRPGLSTDILVREFPDRVFTADVFSTAEALDPASRTLLTEIRMRNEDGLLRPGMYADVTFNVTRTNPPFHVPSTALIIRSGPPRVAIVAPDGVVRLQEVQLGRDFGSTTEITSGLDERDVFIAAPPDDLQEGTSVHPVPADPDL